MPWWGIVLIVAAAIGVILMWLFLWTCLRVGAQADREEEKLWRSRIKQDKREKTRF